MCFIPNSCIHSTVLSQVRLCNGLFKNIHLFKLHQVLVAACGIYTASCGILGFGTWAPL